MPTYVFTYRRPVSYRPNEESTSAWMSWFDTMGDQLVEMGRPVTEGATIGTCDPATTALGGYSVIEAGSLDDALTVAKGCPILDREGGVEVGLLAQVPQPEGAS